MGKLEPVDPERVEELRNMIVLGRAEVMAATAAISAAQERQRAARDLVSDLERELGEYVYPPEGGAS